jgi:hypothetical protein
LPYVIRLFDERGRLARSRPIECLTDDEALEELARVRHPHALELWEEERLVWRFEAPGF